jgi:ArsR family transcriptional regulator
MMNMSGIETLDLAAKAAQLLHLLGQAERLSILLAIGDGEACVCHLEAALGLRQAYISQHLMALREAGIVTSRRDGRNIFYRLENSDLLDLIRQAGQLAGLPETELPFLSYPTVLGNCPCPHCTGEESACG